MSHSLAARVCTGTGVTVACTLALLAVSGATGFPEIALLVLLAVAVGTLAATLPARRRTAPAPASTPASVPAPAAYAPSRH